MQQDTEAFRLAQESIALMKAAIYKLLSNHPEGMKNSEIGRSLGVNADFLDDQQGWLAYTVLKMMEIDRTVEQTKARGPWRLIA